jgi:ParB/RepB/Spo0J family partition protein
MHLIKVDPRALKENPDRMRQTKSTPQADALLLATIKAVGVVQPPVISPERDGGNGYVINAGHRRVKQAIAAGLEEIEVLVDDAANDNGAMRSMVENVAREPLNPVDQWRAIERLVALGWTEEAIGVALALPVRQIRKLRLLANILPAMLESMAKGDMPEEKQLRVIAAASLDEQREVWKAHKPKKGDPQVSWWSVANALDRRKMFARDASFDDDLARAYGIAWVEDLFAPAGEDSRYTTDVEAFLGAQQEWMTNHLPKKGVIVEVNNWGQPVLPAKAERVHGKPGKGDCAAMYLDRDGKVQTAHYRMPEPKKPAKGKAGVVSGTNGAEGSESGGADDEATIVGRPRPDVTRKGVEMIGDLRTDALHEALARAPIEDFVLMALLVLALAGKNVSVQSGSSDDVYGLARMERHAARLVGESGELAFDIETLRAATRAALIDTLSARENRTDSGIVARIAGSAVGADNFLVNMGTEDFLSCLSRPALERCCANTQVLPRPRAKDTRAALVENFREQRFVHPFALFAPGKAEVAAWLSGREEDGIEDADDLAGASEKEPGADGGPVDPADLGDADEPVEGADVTERRSDKAPYPLAAE